MAVFVSPGVYSREIDLSLYAPALSTTIFGVVGAAHKGPLNEPTFVGSIPEYTEVFGLPTTPMGRAAYQYLRFGRQLRVVRVAHDDVKGYVNLLGGGTPTVKIEAITSGTWINDNILTVSAGTQSGTFKVVLELNGYPGEIFDNLLKSNIEESINGVSKYITATNITGNINPPSVPQSLTFVGGVSGDAGLTNSDYIGTISGVTHTGLQCFANAETQDVNLLAVPGVSEAAVLSEVLALCQSRADCFGLIDPPSDLSPQDVVDWHNGEGSWLGMHSAFNSSYGALTWPWHKVFDPYVNDAVWMAPSGIHAAIMAYSDYVSEVWQAPAGMQRGRVSFSMDLEYSPSQGQRDLLYGNGNAVNPFVNFSGDGITLWGQRTLSRTPSALDRINVRRMLLAAEKVLATTLRYIAFEPNDPKTWRQFVNLADSVLAPIQSRRGIYSYRLICDESTNTPDVIDQNQMVGKILLKPTKTAEVIRVDWTLLSTGAMFEEFV